MTERITVDRLNVDRSDLDDFRRLRMKDSPFAKDQNKDIFIAAMVIGFREKCKLKLRKREGFIRKAYLSPQDLALINAIAISEENSLNVLLDERKVFSIAEEYATGGISLLKNLIFGSDDFGSYSKKLQSEMLRDYKELKKSEPKTDRSLETLFALPVEEIISLGEKDKIEFKSSMLYDYDRKQKNKLMGMIIAKTISSFLNSDGGILLIGIDDEGNVLGIKKDLQTLENPNLDQFEINFTNIIVQYLGKIPRRFVEIKFSKVEKKDIAIVHTKPSPRPVYVKYKNEKKFYIRQGNCSLPLDIEDATVYIRDNWPAL
jgi:hypothetical protein